MSPIEHIHLLGIGGSAMAPLAGMLKERGYHVTGADVHVYPPASTLLESLGISWHDGFDEAHLTPAPDLVVIGNALSRGNPEVEAVLDRKIAYRSLPEVLKEFFLPGHESIVVAGTHGKTTTTSLLAWLFHCGGRRPNFLIGGVAENFGRSYGLGGGEEFILEGDEYDSAFFDKGPKFLHYRPDELIFTSLEFDHADIYADLAAVELQFRRLVNLLPRRGKIIAWGDDPREVKPDRPWKSISAETTYAQDLADVREMRAELARLAARVASSLEKKNLLARTVTIKVRFGDFTTVTRSHTADRPSRDAGEFRERALALLERTEAARRPVRLLGVGSHALVAGNSGEEIPYPEQLSLG